MATVSNPMTEFEQEVVTGLATLQAEMREVRKTLVELGVIDRKVINLEHEIASLRAEVQRSRAERQLEITQLKTEMAEMGRQVRNLAGEVSELAEARAEVTTGLKWSGVTLQWAWRIASAIGGAMAVWFAKEK